MGILYLYMTNELEKGLFCCYMCLLLEDYLLASSKIVFAILNLNLTSDLLNSTVYLSINNTRTLLTSMIVEVGKPRAQTFVSF